MWIAISLFLAMGWMWGAFCSRHIMREKPKAVVDPVLAFWFGPVLLVISIILAVLLLPVALIRGTIQSKDA